MAKHHVYGIDLGSYEIKVYDLEKDNIWTEKNVVAVDSSGALLAVGDETTVKVHFHTNEPWKVLEYCASLGEIFDVVIEDMDRQSRGLKG